MFVCFLIILRMQSAVLNKIMYLFTFVFLGFIYFQSSSLHNMQASSRNPVISKKRVCLSFILECINQKSKQLGSINLKDGLGALKEKYRVLIQAKYKRISTTGCKLCSIWTWLKTLLWQKNALRFFQLGNFFFIFCLMISE